MIAIDLSKQKAIQQINFTANLDQPGNLIMIFIIEETKETILDISQGIVNLFYFNIISV